MCLRPLRHSKLILPGGCCCHHLCRHWPLWGSRNVALYRQRLIAKALSRGASSWSKLIVCTLVMLLDAAHAWRYWRVHGWHRCVARCLRLQVRLCSIEVSVSPWCEARWTLAELRASAVGEPADLTLWWWMGWHAVARVAQHGAREGAVARSSRRSLHVLGSWSSKLLVLLLCWVK